ncbi:MAG: hypothetical protein HY914_02995 [Desulfomonile tiedjei]|nr:hypothetical protein [Desulfomonile tiedjei]
MTPMFVSLLAALLVAAVTLIHADSLAAEKKIAVMWVGESEMPTNVIKGFLPRLKELAPDMRVTVKMALPDFQIAGQLFHDFETQMDGIVFLRSGGAEFLGKAKPKIPCFVGDTNNPRELGVVLNLEKPEGNITGVTNYVPYSKRLAAIQTIFPNVKSVGLLLEKDHPGTPIDQEGTSTECEKLRIEYQEFVAANRDDLAKGAKELASKVQLLIASSTALCEDNTPLLVEISHATKVPLFAYSDAAVKNGALAGLAARSDVLGRMLADSVVDVVVKGKPVAQVPVKTDPDPRIALNEKEMEFFGIRLPPSVLREAQIVKKR